MHHLLTISYCVISRGCIFKQPISDQAMQSSDIEQQPLEEVESLYM